MPSILRSIVLSTLGTISLVLALLWAIGDERFVPSLSNPHLLTSAGILLLTGIIYHIQKRISEEIFLSVSPFTLRMVCRLYLGLWLHVPAGKQVSRRLLQHDFPFIFPFLPVPCLEMETEAGRFPLVCLNRPLFFFHDPRTPDLHRLLYHL